ENLELKRFVSELRLFRAVVHGTLDPQLVVNLLARSIDGTIRNRKSLDLTGRGLTSVVTPNIVETHVGESPFGSCRHREPLVAMVFDLFVDSHHGLAIGISCLGKIANIDTW